MNGPLLTLSQRDAWKKLTLSKSGKRCLKLRFFLWFTHLCETDWLGVSKDIKEILIFYKNELRRYFHCYIFIPRKCPRKTLFLQTGGGADYVQFISFSPPKFWTFRRHWCSKWKTKVRGYHQLWIILVRTWPRKWNTILWWDTFWCRFFFECVNTYLYLWKSPFYSTF